MRQKGKKTMGRTEQLKATGFSDGGMIHLKNNDPTESDERELTSEIAGMRVFALLNDPDTCRLILDEAMTLTDDERQAVRTVISVLERFDLYGLEKLSALIAMDHIEDAMKAEILTQSIAMTAILASVAEMLNLIAGAKDMDVLLSKDMARGLRIIRGSGSKNMDADVQTNIG
jgi:hypothetical protein